MNRIHSILHLSFRGYRSNRGKVSSRRRDASRGEMTMPQSEIFSKNFAVMDSEEHEDFDEFEPEFSNVGEYHKMHEKEMQIKKEKLKDQIVRRKYFKSEDPPMLTWAEKEQIRLLHSRDPEKWTVEMLSDSFPANRDAILRVIRANWTPKSVKSVTNYDEKVKRNWELYKAGKLLVSPELRACLEKFKNRKIEPMDPEVIAQKLVKQKPVFKKPQSTMFSNIIQSYLDAHPELKDDENDEIIDKSKKESVKQIADGETVANNLEVRKENTKLKTVKSKISNDESLTFDEFLKRRVEDIEVEKMTVVDRVLVDEYKQRKTEAYKDASLNFPSESAVDSSKNKRESQEAKSLVFESQSAVHTTEELEKVEENFEEIVAIRESKERELTKGNWSSAGVQNDMSSIGSVRISEDDGIQEINYIHEDLMRFDKGSLETGIILREKKQDALDCDYPSAIHIPKKKYKRGVTYKVEDRYYDADGEFLYRVIGIKS